MISLEREKNAPNWVTTNKIRLSLYQPIGFRLSFSRSILNAHRASSKRIQNKNDNLNFNDEYKIKERGKKKINIRRHMSVLVALE
jgi:hypothetical protein